MVQKSLFKSLFFHDLWALYQPHLSQHEISSIMGDFAMNLLDESVSGESWKMYELPKFDQTSTDPSKLVFTAKLRVLKHQVLDEPLPFSNEDHLCSSCRIFKENKLKT